MKTALTVTKKDFRKFYLYQYYNQKSLLIRVMRFICGPLLIAMGLHLIGQTQKFGIAYGGFCTGYGIYYSLKPFLYLLFKRFTPQEVSLEVKDSFLLFESKEGRSEIDLSKLKTYATLSFFVIELENNQTVFIPKAKLSIEVKEALEGKIKINA